MKWRPHMARKPDTHHVLPLFCDDLIASCVDMTPACFGAYLRLLCFAWTRGGIPDHEAACGRIAGGIDHEDWVQIRARLTVLHDGRLSHDRLERERAAVADIREERAKAGSAGGKAKAANLANLKQPSSKPVANDLANGQQTGSKSVAPYPSLILPMGEERQYARAAGGPPDEAAGGRPEPRTEENPEDRPAAGPGALGNGAAVPGRGRMAAEPGAGNTRRPGEDDWRRPGWVHDEWARIVAAWNSTDRAVPWTLATPPNGFADLAACPGWVETALAAVAMLPDCRRFARPVPWTQFVRDLDRIIAGEFRDPATERRELAAAGGRQQKRGNMR